MTLKRRPARRGARIIPPAERPDDPNRQTPHFCLAYLSADYAPSRCQQNERAAFATKLEELCKLTWLQIIQAPRHGSGCEKIARQSIAATIPTSITEDVESFLSLRFDGMKAMIGFRRGRVLHIVWLDRNFTVYQH